MPILSIASKSQGKQEKVYKSNMRLFGCCTFLNCLGIVYQPPAMVMQVPVMEGLHRFCLTGPKYFQSNW